MAASRNATPSANLTPERWQQVKDLLGQALELEPSERASFLEQACGEDYALRSEIDALLAADSDGELLDQPIAVLNDEDIGSEGERTRIGRRLGPYQVVEEIGCGGMGEVYRAFRADDQYKKEVAIKLMRAGQDSKFVVERFKRERQVLASLDHPNIAHLLDGGTTDDGIPYFVMELIAGQSLIEYCDQQKLATTERLKLFLKVCSAVQYAHQRLIIHRDLKPSNVLVTVDGVPKLLDFGIAKMLDQEDATEKPDATMSMFRLLTPAYASPEQVTGEAITTASDVYSLGVILYECLTGHRPYSARAQASHEILRAVCEVEPEKPSTVIRRIETRTAGEETIEITPGSISTVRDGTPDKLGKRLRGDLDNIVLMALRKEPHRRYASVEQFSTDITRHLEQLPVIASQDTVRYRMAKFVARHSAGVATAVALLLVVLAGLAATLYEAHRAKQNELRAEKRFNDVRSLANSLLFNIHDSIRDLPGSTPARKLIVEQSLRYLDSLASESRDDPSLERELATAYERVGEVQGHYLLSNLGETENALHSYQKALAIRKILAAPKNADLEDQVALVRCQRLVGSQMAAIGEVQSAFQNVQAALALGESLRTKYPQDTNVLSELSFSYEIRGQIQRGNWTTLAGLGDRAAALDSYRRAVELDKVLVQLDPTRESFQRALWHDEIDYADMIRLLDGAKWPQALEVYKQALQVTKKINEETPSTQRARDLTNVYNRMGMAYDALGDHVRSFESHHEAAKIYEDLLSKDPSNAMIKQGLAIAYANSGEELGKGLHQRTESEAYLDKSVELMQALVKSSPQNASQVGVLAQTFVSRARNFLYWKNPTAALRDYESAVQLYRGLAAKDATNMGPRSRVFLYRVAAVSILVQLRKPLKPAELQSAVNDAEPLLTGNQADDEVLYAAAIAYAELGDIETAAALHTGSGGKKDHWRSGAHWYESSLKAFANIRDPANKAKSSDFDPFDPAVISKRLVICRSAVRVTPAH